MTKESDRIYAAARGRCQGQHPELSVVMDEVLKSLDRVWAWIGAHGGELAGDPISPDAPVELPDDNPGASACPFCGRTDEHKHEYVDVLSPECDHELAKLRAQLRDARTNLNDECSSHQATTIQLDESRAEVEALRARVAEETELRSRYFSERNHYRAIVLAHGGALPASEPETPATKEGE